MKRLLWLGALLLAGGCAGVSINPISPEKGANAHTKGGVDGYIVYGPMILLQIGETPVCPQRKPDGTCAVAEKVVCSVGAPIVLPDYSKPFSVEIKSGFGKAGADITIADGWRLAGVKDSSDNTALVSFIEKAAGFKADSVSTSNAGKPCGKVNPGLYRWILEGDKTKLVELTP